MIIKEVVSKRGARCFARVPLMLYKNNPYWVRPLDVDVDSVFDETRNKMFSHGVCRRWLLLGEKEEILGRVAAFVDYKAANLGNDQPTGGMGFFECINDQRAAFMLFDQCREWLLSKGMEAMDGPINFGSRDRWWGLLVNGFDKKPNYQCNYNLSYYKDLFDAYGFKIYFKQFTYGRLIGKPLSEKLAKKAELLRKNPDYSFRPLFRSEYDKLSTYIGQVYNAAWASHNAPPLSERQIKLMIKQMKPIIDMRLIIFGFFKGRPVSFFLSIPEINEVLQYVKGKLDWMGKLKFLWYSYSKKKRKALGILFGVVPKHRGKGLDGAMISTLKSKLDKDMVKYNKYEMNWIGDFNSPMLVIVKQLEADITKVHYTYRKLFDERKPFKRYPIKP